MQRLAHSHVDEVAELPVLAGNQFAGRVNLGNDLACSEAAGEPEGAGRAEATGHRAADLGGEAEGLSVVPHRDEHALDLRTVLQIDDQPPGTIGAAVNRRQHDLCGVALGCNHPGVPPEKWDLGEGEHVTVHPSIDPRGVLCTDSDLVQEGRHFRIWKTEQVD